MVVVVKWSVLLTKTLFLEGLCSKHTAQPVHGRPCSLTRLWIKVAACL